MNGERKFEYIKISHQALPPSSQPGLFYRKRKTAWIERKVTPSCPLPRCLVYCAIAGQGIGPCFKMSPTLPNALWALRRVQG